MWDTKLPELGFHLGFGVIAWRGRVEEPERKKSGDGEFPTVIYLFTNRATLCKPQECLAPWPIISFKLLQVLAVHLLPYWGWLDKG